jgi:hypothetical protein
MSGGADAGTRWAILRALSNRVLTGEKSPGGFLIRPGRLVAGQVEGVGIKVGVHWLTEDATPRSSRNSWTSSTAEALPPIL